MQEQKKAMSQQHSAYILSSVNCLKIIPSLWKRILGIYRRFHNIDLKNHTHVRKVRHTSEIPFGTYWWTLKNPKNQTFEKMNKNCWRYHFTHVYQKPQSYEVKFLRYRVWQNYFVILGHHHHQHHQHHPNNPENQNFEKMKKSSFGDVIILNLCNKKHDIWCMLTQTWNATDNFLSF